MDYNRHLDSCVYFSMKDYKPINKKKTIHKIVDNDFFIRNELTNIKKLKTFDKNFYICQNSEDLGVIELDEQDKCINSEKYIKNDNTILLNFEDRELIYFKTYLKTVETSRMYVNTLIQFYKHLLHSIDLLVKRDIVHNHITFDSVVIDKHRYPLLTNFSFSLDTSRQDIDQYIKHFVVAYDPTYIEWPLEMHLLSYLLTNKLNSLSSYNIETIVATLIENNTILKTFGHNVVSSYKTESIHYFKKYINQSYEYILTDMLQYSNTWDNYALSMMFLRILIGIHKTIGVKNKFIILFMKLLVSNIHLSPLKRLSIEETIVQFENILDNIEIKDYKEILDNLMSV